MKKLLILAATALVAVCSQAASFNWKAANVYDYTGEALYSGAATLYVMSEDASTTIATFNGTMSGGAINQLVTSDDFVVGTKYTAYYTMETAGYEFTSGSKTAKTLSPSNASFAFSATGSWTAAVPEPTSGLLMLLGLAGLALKRKRA